MNLTWALSYTLVSLITSATIFLIYRRVTYEMGEKKEIDLFRLFLVAFLSFIISNGVCVWANYDRGQSIGTMFTAVGLVSICASAYFWFSYIEARLNPHRREDRKHRFVVALPMLIVMLLIVMSPFNHLIYYYSEDGDFCRGRLYPVILIAVFLYLITATIHTYKKIQFARTRAQKKQYTYLMAFIVFPFLAGVIDLIHAHLPSMELVVMYGIVLIYLNLQHAQIYRDGLTGLNNRKLIDEYMQENIILASEEKPIYFFVSDIDRFKGINDRFGHLEGDRALKLVADVLKKYGDSDQCHISRWGGDEFVFIVDTEKYFDPEDFKKQIAEDIRTKTTALKLPYEICLSTGYVRCADPNTEVDEIIRQADQRMYAEKTSASRKG